MTQVLVTGMPRSGTTLLDKLLSSHPAALVFSQPLPLLYVEVKRRFLQDRELGAASRAYPLNDMFRTNYYASEAFQAFLETFLLEPIFCREVLAAMVAFDGRYIKPADPFAFLEDYKASRLFDFVRSYVRWLADGDCPVVTGSKETFCEEYIPYFLANGATVIQLVRDPRDVVTSLNFGHGERFGDRIKPHLFNLRQWRKSVAFALQHTRHPRFAAVRFEDLVHDPAHTLAHITDTLRLEPLSEDVLRSDIRTSDGRVWHSTSSHVSSPRIDPSVIGSYRWHLDDRTKRFIQACCAAEMRAFGYHLDISQEEIPEILVDYRDDTALARPELAGYVWSAKRRREELERWACLEGGRYDPSFFTFERVFRRLRAHVCQI